MQYTQPYRSSAVTLPQPRLRLSGRILALIVWLPIAAFVAWGMMAGAGSISVTPPAEPRQAQEQRAPGGEQSVEQPVVLPGDPSSPADTRP
jgi:hypothetical protein